jgi:hypothetical protein
MYYCEHIAGPEASEYGGRVMQIAAFALIEHADDGR